ncbi:hypothetical protein [Gordonia aichiensis]|nr:hypothetical protein [Gordonia aichiensis]
MSADVAERGQPGTGLHRLIGPLFDDIRRWTRRVTPEDHDWFDLATG